MTELVTPPVAFRASIVIHELGREPRSCAMELDTVDPADPRKEKIVSPTQRLCDEVLAIMSPAARKGEVTVEWLEVLSLEFPPDYLREMPQRFVVNR